MRDHEIADPFGTFVTGRSARLIDHMDEVQQCVPAAWDARPLDSQDEAHAIVGESGARELARELRGNGRGQRARRIEALSRRYAKGAS